jgi:hypothetical protein
MERDRSRVLAGLIAYLILVVASTFVMDWFVMTGGGMLMGAAGTIGIDLRSVTLCADAGPCVSVSFSSIPNKGLFPLIATSTFWGTIFVSLGVVYQAGTRIISGHANDTIGKMATFGAIAMIAAAGATGFLFAPELGSAQSELTGLTVERTWAPALLILAGVVGIVTLYWAVSHETLDTEADYTPVVPLPAARVIPQTQDIRPVGTSSAAERKDTGPEVTTERPPAGPVATTPDHLRKKIRYATLAAEVTCAGIDARREDGSLLLVLWGDVVGVVARRLPAELDGATFVDVVSTAGATLRILPWTRITGELVPGAGDDRARALVALVVASCPAITLDARTQAFSDKGEAAQLPDLAKLAQHDERLA